MMWEQWHAEVERSVREGELACDHAYGHEARAALPSRPLRLFGLRLPSVRSRRREGIPASWRLRMPASRVGPIL